MRYTKWVDYYSSKLTLFNSSGLFLIDDGSSNIHFDKRITICNSDELPSSLDNEINMFHFENRLGRASMVEYPGWWRSFLFSVKLAKKYNIKKIIHIESDFYIASKRMISYIEGLSSGWTTFFSRHYNFPETAVQVICEDSFDKLNKLFELAVAQNFKFDKIAEFTFPFTKIEQDFYGDRFGETSVLENWLDNIEIPFEIDYIGQMNDTEKLEDYNRYFKFDYTA
jgi:hypothetical protein